MSELQNQESPAEVPDPGVAEFTSGEMRALLGGTALLGFGLTIGHDVDLGAAVGITGVLVAGGALLKNMWRNDRNPFRAN